MVNGAAVCAAFQSSSPCLLPLIPPRSQPGASTNILGTGRHCTRETSPIQPLETFHQPKIAGLRRCRQSWVLTLTDVGQCRGTSVTRTAWQNTALCECPTPSFLPTEAGYLVGTCLGIRPDRCHLLTKGPYLQVWGDANRFYRNFLTWKGKTGG